MAEARVREPSAFHGTQEEDGQDWLERFEELADMNKWKGANKLTCVKSYLEGTARKWFRIKKPASWEDFREKFLMAFEFKNFLFKVETRLRSRRQGLNGSIETYFYDVLSLCTQLEEESETEMSELTKVNYLLNGLTPTLLDRLWPLVPEPINSTDSLLAAALKHAQAREMMASLQPKAFPSRQYKREDSDTEESDLKYMIRQLKKDLDATNRKLDARPNWQPNFTNNEYQRNNYEQPRKQTRFVNENPRFQQTNRFQSNRTTDGRPICNICRKPGHIARFCKSRNEEYPRAVNALHAIGKSLVKKEVLCNGIKAEALIDTGAALTAVSEQFANGCAKSKCAWTGPAISLANGEMTWPTCGIHVNIKIGQKKAKGVAIVMPLPNTDILIGNDLLRQFGNIEIHYSKQADDDYDFFNVTPSQQTPIVLSQDIVVPAKSVVPVETNLVPDQTWNKKGFFCSRAIYTIICKKGSKPRALDHHLLGPNIAD